MVKRRPGRLFAAALSLALVSCTSRDVRKGSTCLALGDYPLAIRFFEAAVAREPADYQARLGLGQALIQKSAAEGVGADFARALMQLEACRTLRPSEDLSALLADAYAERARYLLRSADTASALAALAKSVEHRARPVALNLAGIVYAKSGDADKAETLFRKSLSLDSASASAHFNLGMLKWQRGEAGAARAHWLRTLRALPDDEDALYWFAAAEKRLREGK